MRWWGERWVVMVPGEVRWVKRRTRELLVDDEARYTVVPGRGRYHAIVQDDGHDSEPENFLANSLSLECEGPVYCIEGNPKYLCVWRYVKGEDEWEDRDLDELVRELGCVMPWDNEPPPPPLARVTRTVVLIQGLSKAQVRQALAKKAGHPVPEGYYLLEEAPHGLFLREGTGELLSEALTLARRFPRATLYSVVAKPDLSYFIVNIKRNRKTQQFAVPPRESSLYSLYPIVQDVLGERTPEKILEVLGMSKEWFRL